MAGMTKMNKRQKKKFHKKYEFKSFKLYKVYKLQQELLLYISKELNVPRFVADIVLHAQYGLGYMKEVKKEINNHE